MQDMKNLFRIFAFVLCLFLLTFCDNTTEATNSNAPSSHTVNKDGVRHNTGLTNPTVNCVGCHGSDLKGGSVGVSCYSCHGKKW
jgi:hypothetical protein